MNEQPVHKGGTILISRELFASFLRTQIKDVLIVPLYNEWKITQVIYCQCFFVIRTSSAFDYNYFVHTTKSVVRISVYNNSVNRSEVGIFVTLTVSFQNKKLRRIVSDPMFDVIFVEVTSYIV